MEIQHFQHEGNTPSSRQIAPGEIPTSTSEVGNRVLFSHMKQCHPCAMGVEFTDEPTDADCFMNNRGSFTSINPLVKFFISCKVGSVMKCPKGK